MIGQSEAPNSCITVQLIINYYYTFVEYYYYYQVLYVRNWPYWQCVFFRFYNLLDDGYIIIMTYTRGYPTFTRVLQRITIASSCTGSVSASSAGLIKKHIYFFPLKKLRRLLPVQCNDVIYIFRKRLRSFLIDQRNYCITCFCNNKKKINKKTTNKIRTKRHAQSSLCALYYFLNKSLDTKSRQYCNLYFVQVLYDNITFILFKIMQVVGTLYILILYW